MKREELILCVGGAISITSIMNSVVKVGDFLLEVGRSIGSAIRYLKSGRRC